MGGAALIAATDGARRIAMRLSLFMVGVSLITAALGTRAQAQNYPWCALYDKGDGSDTVCGFISFDQCMADVRGIGGFCMPNNTYHPVAATPQAHSPVRHKPHKSS
jgi:hypothetical protein